MTSSDIPTLVAQSTVYLIVYFSTPATIQVCLFSKLHPTHPSLADVLQKSISNPHCTRCSNPLFNAYLYSCKSRSLYTEVSLGIVQLAVASTSFNSSIILNLILNQGIQFIRTRALYPRNVVVTTLLVLTAGGTLVLFGVCEV